MFQTLIQAHTTRFFPGRALLAVGLSLALAVPAAAILPANTAQPATGRSQGPVSETATLLKPLEGGVIESPGGRYLASVEGGTVKIFDRRLGKVVRKLSNPDSMGELYSACYTPDGRYLVTGASRGLFIFWPTWHHQPAFTIDVHKTDKMYGIPVAISPDSRYLAAGRLSNNPDNGALIYEIDIFEIPTRRFVRRLLVSEGLDTSPGHSPSMEIAFHPLGRYLAAGVEYDQGHHALKHEYIKIFDFETNRWAWWLKGAPPLSYSANGKYFVFQSPTRHLEGNHHHWAIRLWNTRANKLKTLQANMDYGSSNLALSPDGNYLLAEAADKIGTEPKLRLFSARSGAQLQTLEIKEGLDKAHSFSRDGRELFSFYPYYKTAPLEIRRVD